MLNVGMVYYLHNNYNIILVTRGFSIEEPLFYCLKRSRQNGRKDKKMDVERYVYVKVPRFSTIVDGIERKLKKNKVKIMGILMVILGMVACMLFPEDASGGAVACLLGFAVVNIAKAK